MWIFDRSMGRFAGMAGLALLAVGAGCDEGPTVPETEPGETITLDASSSEDWAYLDLDTPARVVAIEDGATSSAWDMAFRVTGVRINGGENGPAGMQAYCLCQNEGISDAEVMELTADGQLPAFEEVTAADIPAAGAAWSAAAFDEHPWYRYNIAGGHQIWPTFQVFLVKRGSEVFKVQLTGYYGADGTTRQITVRYARLAG